jgi:hypothetical protein
MSERNANVQFFYDNAGWWSYQPSTETPEQGRERCAQSLANAEAWVKAYPRTMWFEWEHDDDADDSFVDTWDEPDARAQWDAVEHTVEGCVLYAPPENGHGKPRVVASLWGIFDATPEYRRVVEAELADEALTAELTKLESRYTA